MATLLLLLSFCVQYYPVKKSRGDRSKPVKFGYDIQMNSEVRQSGSTVIEKLMLEMASLMKENGILKCEKKEVKPVNGSQLKR